MVFTNTIFLFFFFPIFLLLYFAFPIKGKNILLIFGSLVFYTWGEKGIVLFLIISATYNFLFGLFIENYNKKGWLIISLLINLGVLFFFKYLNFAFDNIRTLFSFFGFDTGKLIPSLSFAIPLGISFLTFRAVSYSIDVYYGRIPAARNIISFFTFFVMFPPITAGPIVRYSEISDQIKRRKISIDDISEGIERFITGLIKKVIIANTFAFIADQVFATPFVQISTGWAWIATVAFSFRIYYDFSGYTDMAIGLARILGFRFVENFNFPYIARDIRDFWRRWHISLSKWLRDYLFLPISFSLSRKWKKNITAGIKTDRLIHMIAVTVTFAICGLWHGPTWGFLFWGVFYGFFIIIESAGFGKILKKTWRPVQHLYTLLIILIGWVFFKIEHIEDAFRFLAIMFSYTQGDPAVSSYYTFMYMNKYILVVFIIALIFSTPLYPLISVRIGSGWYGNKIYNRILRLFSSFILLVLFILSLAFIAGGTYNPFLYSKF